MASALSTLDELYLSLAQSAELPLLTADRDFARAARLRHPQRPASIFAVSC